MPEMSEAFAARPGVPYGYPAHNSSYPPAASTSAVSLISSFSPADESEAEEATTRKNKRKWFEKELSTAFGPLSIKTFMKKKYIKWYFVLAIIATLVILMTVFHDDIVKWMEPWAQKIKALPAGWLIFVGILFVISFPPLFGHEIVGIIAGIVYGLWIGFAVVALGTLLGEMGTYFAFKWCCSARAEKYEKEDVNYACLGRVLHEGGFKIILLARLSAIPGHLCTAILASCNFSFWIFFITTVLTLPKQLQVVYLGVIFNNETKTMTDKAISYAVLGFSFIVTLGAAWYIYRQMGKMRPVILEEKALKEASAFSMENDSNVDLTRPPKRPSSRDYLRVEDNVLPPTLAHSPVRIYRSSSNSSMQELVPPQPHEFSQPSDHPYAYTQPSYPRSAIQYARAPAISPFSSPLHNTAILSSAPPRIENEQPYPYEAHQEQYRQQYSRRDEQNLEELGGRPAPGAWGAQQTEDGRYNNTRSGSESLARASSQYIVPY